VPLFVLKQSLTLWVHYRLIISRINTIHRTISSTDLMLANVIKGNPKAKRCLNVYSATMKKSMRFQRRHAPPNGGPLPLSL
jgi:hypothetical protein